MSEFENKSNEGNSDNLIARTLDVIGVINIVVGFIGGLVCGMAEGFFITFIWWLAGALSATAIWGFAEIIHLLQKIENKLK